MKIINAVLFLLGILVSFAMAKKGCTIMPNPISKTLEAYPNRIAVYGKIVKVEAQYSEFEIIEVIHGDAAPKSVIKVWDEKDLECMGKWDMGSEKIGIVGDSAIIIIPEIVDVKNGWDVIGDYRMPHLYGYHSIFKFVDGTSWYEDRTMGIELKRYRVNEFMEIVRSYLRPISIRNSQKPNSISIAYGINRLKKFDVNGKYLKQQELAK